MCAVHLRKEACSPKDLTEVPGDAERLRPFLGLAQKLLVSVSRRKE